MGALAIMITERAKVRLTQRTIPSLLMIAVALSGCHKNNVHVTALPLSPQNQGEPAGIPYYLPKPLLVISKNVRHIDESKVGLTTPAPIPNAFDDQSSYGSIKANVAVPGDTAQQAVNAGGTILPTAFGEVRSSVAGLGEQMTPDADRLKDDIAPDSFFTYEIVFVPDLSQKYVLQIEGGSGEFRAAMNLVNGWMYTGLGPYYMKDSSTAQNMMACGVGAMFAGRGVADVLNEVGELSSISGAAGAGTAERAPVDADEILDKYTRLARALQSETVVPQIMCNFAEIYIYEPTLMPDGSMSWSLIAEHHFDRQYFQPKLSPEAMGVLQSVIGQHASQERAAVAERARAEVEARAERADASSTDSSSVATGTAASRPDELPPALAAPQTIGSRVLEKAAMEQFFSPGLTPTTPALNEINVNVNPEGTLPRPSARKGLLHLLRPDAPKQESRTKRMLELNSASLLAPEVTVPGTLPGRQP